MHRLRALVDIAIRIDVLVEMSVSQPPVDDFDARHFNDAVPLARVEAGGFGIEDDLTHSWLK